MTPAAATPAPEPEVAAAEPAYDPAAYDYSYAAPEAVAAVSMGRHVRAPRASPQSVVALKPPLYRVPQTFRLRNSLPSDIVFAGVFWACVGNCRRHCP